MKANTDTVKRKCYNCKYATKQFKVVNLNHVHCMAPEYEKQNAEGNPPSPWETLRVFSDSCNEHEFKEPKL